MIIFAVMGDHLTNKHDERVITLPAHATFSLKFMNYNILTLNQQKAKINASCL